MLECEMYSHDQWLGRDLLQTCFIFWTLLEKCQDRSNRAARVLRTPVIINTDQHSLWSGFATKRNSRERNSDDGSMRKKGLGGPF